MKLYGGLLSPFVMRAVLAARMKGHEIAVEMPEGGIKSEAYLALNPMGKMPCFVDGDFALPESAVIAEYLDETLSGPKLLPEDPKARAVVRLLARMTDLYLVPALTPIFRARENPEAVPAALDTLSAVLAQLEQVRPHHMSHAATNGWSLADATLMPGFFFLDAFNGAFGTADRLDATPGLKAWWAMVKATPEGSRMMAEQAAGLAAFARPA
jgi:glutathione S-transferase